MAVEQESIQQLSKGINAGEYCSILCRLITELILHVKYCTPFGFPCTPFPAFPCPAVWCRVFYSRVFHSRVFSPRASEVYALPSAVWFVVRSSTLSVSMLASDRPHGWMFDWRNSGEYWLRCQQFVCNVNPYYSAPAVVARSIVMLMSVCVCPWKCIRNTPPNQIAARVTHGRGSIAAHLLALRFDMFFRFYGWRHVCTRRPGIGDAKNGVYSKWLDGGQHGFDTAAISETDRGSIKPRAESAIYDCLVM